MLVRWIGLILKNAVTLEVGLGGKKNETDTKTKIQKVPIVIYQKYRHLWPVPTPFIVLSVLSPP